MNKIKELSRLVEFDLSTRTKALHQKLCDAVNKLYPVRGNHKVAIIHTDDGKCYVNSEVIPADGLPAHDYYGEFRDGLPWIDPKLEKLIKTIGGNSSYWDWMNAAEIVAVIE